MINRNYVVAINKKQVGKNIKGQSNGGFPPIYSCDMKKTTQREFKKRNDNIPSITDIMKLRREIENKK